MLHILQNDIMRKKGILSVRTLEIIVAILSQRISYDFSLCKGLSKQVLGWISG